MKKKIIILLILAMTSALSAFYFAAPDKVYRLFSAMELSSAGLTQHSVQVGDHTIAYLEGGSGPNVLLIHGFSGEKSHWVRFAKYLTGSYHVIIPDVPGFGESSKLPEATYDIESQASRLLALTEKLKLDAFHVAGNSMGGRITCAITLREPKRVLSMALFDSSGVTPPKKSEHQLAWDRGTNLLLVNSVADFDRVMKLNFTKPPWIPGPVKRYFAEKAVESRAFNEKIEKDLRKDAVNLEQQLGRIAAPALILWGDDDRILDMSAVGVFEKGLRNHTTVIMKRCGHTPMLERPDESARHYLTFLKGR